MTNYKQSNETNRNDIDLLVAIKKEIEVYAQALIAAAKEMQKALDLLKHAPRIDEDMYGMSSGMPHIRYELHSAIEKFKVKHSRLTKTNIDAYVGNIAAFMSERQAEELKEKYSENSTDK